MKGRIIMIKILSIHVTPDCNTNPPCPFCYSKPSYDRRLPLEWFYDIPKAARDLGVEQIPVGGGEVTLYPKFLDKFTKLCRNNDIIVNLTTNGTNPIPEKIIKRLGCVSFSLDKYKFTKLDWIDNIKSNLLRSIDIANKNKDMYEKDTPMIGINYLLLDRASLYVLPKVIEIALFKWNVNNIYILQLKNYKVDYTSDDLRKVLYPLVALLGDRILVDDSIHLSLGKKEQCHFGGDFCSIDYNGNVKGCSFSSPIAKIDKPSELKDVILSKFPLESYNKCPYVK